MSGSIWGIVPAAGRSSRIGGGPKPLLDTGDGSFLERVVRALRDGGADEVHVGVRHDPSPVAAEAHRNGARVHCPDGLDAGPIATVRHVLNEAREHGSPLDAVLFLQADMPAVSARTVRELVAAWRARPDAPIALPATPDGATGHPALFAHSLFGELCAPGLDEGARTVVEAHRSEALIVEVDDPGIHLDIDTLPEYRRAYPDAYRRRFQKW